MEDSDSDLPKIPPPVNWPSNPKSLKMQQVFCSDIIDVDDYQDFSMSGNSDPKFKGKQAVNASAGTRNNAYGNDVKVAGEGYKGSKYSNGSFYEEDLIYVEDDLMEYALLQSKMDVLDVPTGIEALCPDIIDVDDYQDFSLSGKYDPKFKGKQTISAGTRNYAYGNDVKDTGNSSKGSQYSNASFNEEDLIYVDDDLMEYALLQSKMDVFDVPTGIDVSIPWFTNENNVSAPTQFVSQPQDDLKGFQSSKAYGFHGNSDSGKNPLPPHVHVLHSVQNQTYSAVNTFPKYSLPYGNKKPLAQPIEQVVHSSPKQYITARSSSPKASVSTREGSFYNLGPNMNAGCNPPFPNSMGIQMNSTSSGKVSSSPGPSSSKSVNENLHVNLRKLDLFKKFDTADDCSDHSFSKSNAFAMNQPPRSWSKKIQDEWRILENDLPDRIFVRVYESRMDLLRAAIIGAEGTPYHDGLFFFDVFFPSNYPNVPPQVNYHSGGLRINPNLYKCGKVCLSLLNTWSGSGNEMWIPGKSTILQVLVSIQGIILNEKPYFNEPGYEASKGTVSGDMHSLDYNEKTLIYSLKTMVYSMNKPPKHFEDLVVGHFFKRAHDILEVCKAYKNGAQVGSVVVEGGVAKVNNKGSRCTSQSFKNELAGCLKTLVKAFGQVGVKDCDRFLH